MSTITKNRLFYLASPFRSKDQFEMVKRFHIVESATVSLLAKGVHVFCPISYNGRWPRGSYSQFGLPASWDFWEPIDKNFLIRCDGMIVLKMDGWEESEGIRSEIKFCEVYNIPVYYIDVDDAFNDRNNVLELFKDN